jgi:large subunit ribosomal protein L21
MYAIVEISGKQFKVSESELVKVPVQNAEINQKLQFPNVLLTEKDGKVDIGAPFVKNTSVSATVVEHGRDKKIVVFKKKRRKDYKVKRGHRQGYTMIKVDAIGSVKPKGSDKPATGTTKKSSAKAAPVSEKKTEKE